MAELALERKKKKNQGFFQVAASIGGWLFWIWVGGGWMRKREKQRDGEQRERERDFLYYFINLYYFNVLYVKINNKILSVL